MSSSFASVIVTSFLAGASLGEGVGACADFARAVGRAFGSALGAIHKRDGGSLTRSSMTHSEPGSRNGDTLRALSELRLTELTTELSLRKKQYNHYRDQLLSFEEGEAEWKTLGDVTKKWYSGGTPTAKKSEYYDGGEIPWLRTQEVKFADIQETDVKITTAALKNSSAKWIPENCVIIAISGATAGRSAINKIPLTTNQHCGCLEIDSTKALYRYVFHWVSFNYENIKSLGQGARGDLNSTIIKNFRLPIPYGEDPEKSLAEQARIVAILDKFDTLTTSISEGLPREIELRQKQYEYYRDLLLSFPKPDTSESEAAA